MKHIANYDKTKLPEEQWYESKYDGKIKKTIGKQNFDFQIKKIFVSVRICKKVVI